VTSPGVAKVSVGRTYDRLQFISMSSVSVTAGSAASQVMADGGKNTFAAAVEPIRVAGGAGADARAILTIHKSLHRP
jgi:hypothetical protein